jgi:transposase
VRWVRDLSCGETRVYLEPDVRRVACWSCGLVKRQRLDFQSDNPLYAKRFAFYIGRRVRTASTRDVVR